NVDWFVAIGIAIYVVGSSVHACFSLCKRQFRNAVRRVLKDWQDEERTYIPSEQVLNVRLDCMAGRLVTA
ncbi:hypothetical protein LCGC14_0909980, partial [marine sediment metagenome]